MPTGSFTAAAVRERVADLAGGSAHLRCVIAWSGGLDSTVLLHTLRGAAGMSVRAVHVDHGLQPAARDFRAFCRSTARQWHVPLTIVKAAVRWQPGDSVEQMAREARLAALASGLRAGELLLTAQHADDQLETVLLALLRGAGPAGLAAMPASMPFGGTRLLRPLLGFERLQLTAYAAQQGLAWSEDPSNALSRFDRNFLRAEVLPALRRRWPAAARTVARSARHCAVAAVAIAAAVARDVAAAADGAGLEIAVLRRWPPARRAAALREWIVASGHRAPGERHLQQIDTLIAARADAHPELRLSGLVVRRNGGRLLLAAPDAATADAGVPAAVPAGAGDSWQWSRGALTFDNGAELAILRDAHGDLDLDALPEHLAVRFCPPRAGRRLRKLMQQLAVPLPLRRRVPLLFAAGSDGSEARLLAVADLWLDATIRSTARGRSSGRIFWRDGH